MGRTIAARIRRAICGCLGAAVVGTLLVCQSPAQAVSATAITLDGARQGAQYYGVGAISGGGGNSRLLIDYPEPERSAVLDYLFRPNYGATIQLLKLEIGGDSNTSDGAEPSIEHTQGAVDCNQGYEWWLAEQAIKRNSNVKLYGLQWGAPGWVADPASGSLFTQADIGYLLDWLGCAKSHGLTVSYLGGWNERAAATNPNVQAWYEQLRAALNSNGYAAVKLVSADSVGGDMWSSASVMNADPKFRAAVQVLGVHDNCGYPPADTMPFGYTCTGSNAARATKAPMWVSEAGKMHRDKGAPTMIRQIINGYVQDGITGFLTYPLLDSMVPNIPMQARGLITAKQPWTGNYTVNEFTWAIAQLTQFVPQGWYHIDNANKVLGSTGSYNSFESANHRQWSLIAQNTGASAQQAVTPRNISVTLKGGLNQGTVHVWGTNLWSSDPTKWFVHKADVRISKGVFHYTIPPGWVISFTNRAAGQSKGPAAATAPAAGAAPLSYTATPDATGMPTGLSPIDGAFGYTPCQGGRTGSCLTQQDTQEPVYWENPTTPGQRHPYAVLGDTTWSDYTIGADVYLPDPTSTAGLIGRYSLCTDKGDQLDQCPINNSQRFSGYEFTLTGDGSWHLYRNSVSEGQAESTGTLSVPLSRAAANGRTPRANGLLPHLDVEEPAWHHLQLTMTGDTLTAALDGQTVTTVPDDQYTTGPAGIETNWSGVQFDNLTVVPAG